MDQSKRKNLRTWISSRISLIPEEPFPEILSETIQKKRNARIAIREAALRGTTCFILYRKFEDKKVKRYEVLPTEYANRKDKNGKWRKALWVQDCHEGRDRRQIKLFYCSGILKAVVTDRKRKPKWPILIV